MPHTDQRTITKVDITEKYDNKTFVCSDGWRIQFFRNKLQLLYFIYTVHWSLQMITSREQTEIHLS